MSVAPSLTDLLLQPTTPNRTKLDCLSELLRRSCSEIQVKLTIGERYHPPSVPR